MHLAASPFRDIVTTAEAIGSGLGLPAVIALYTAWIAAQPPGTPDLPSAWFNLGTELGTTGDVPMAMHAYRAALAISPGFAPAAINLGLQLERHGQSQAALQVWTDALQPDDSRIALLNQQARLLEQSGQLARAADLLRTSLLTRHDQPDGAVSDIATSQECVIHNCDSR